MNLKLLRSTYGGLIILVMIGEHIVYLACSTKYTTLTPFFKGSYIYQTT
jgi:hypothetical protein